MANSTGILLLAFIFACSAAFAYPRRGYYYPSQDSIESSSSEEQQQDRDDIYQLIPVQRDPRSVPSGDNTIVVPRRQIMMAMAPPPGRPGPPPQDSYRPRFYEERERDHEQEPERDYLYAAPTTYEPAQAATGDNNGHYDYVDYGAYTGGHGAFGWYSDHPVYVQSNHQ